MYLFRRFYLAGLVVLVVLAPPGIGRTLELGLTPSHVYSLWLNINKSLIAYARIYIDSEKTLDELDAMEPAVFAGKLPADVYARADKINALFIGRIVVPTGLPHWLTGFEQLASAQDTGVEKITPSAVFIISTQLLNAIVDVVVANTGWEQSVSDLYAVKQYSGKTSSDVFGLVDLAFRRTVIILAAGE